MGTSALVRQFYFTGGTALTAFHLGHRDSEDLDFFSLREIHEVELKPFRDWCRRKQYQAEWSVHGPRFTALLSRQRSRLKVDFAYYPYPRIESGMTWQRLSIDGAKDIAVNKIQAIATRVESKDFIDLYYLAQRHPDWSLDGLRRLARLKFDVTMDPFTLGEKFMSVQSFKDFPRMHLPFSRQAFRSFFVEAARQIARR